MNVRLVRQFFVVVAALALGYAASSILAQEDAKQTLPDDSGADAATAAMPQDQPPGTEPAPGDTPAKGGAATPAAPKTDEPKQQSYLMWMITASGPIGAVLFIMSFIAVGLTVMFVMEMRYTKIIPQQLVDEFERRIKEKKYQEAYDLAKADQSFLGKVLAAGLGRLSKGYAEAIEAMHEVGEDESMRMEHRLSWLAILGTTGPLLGLLGTVEGIIASFRVIAQSTTQPKPNDLAKGISTSLFNTFEGLLVAIIATIAFMLLKNQMARLVLEVGMKSSTLMSQFSSLVRGKSGTSGAVATEAN